MSPPPHEQHHRIANRLAGFGAAETDAALGFFLSEIARLIGADDAFWVGAVRIRHGAAARADLQHGWRGRAVRLLHPSPAGRMQAARSMRQQDTPETSLTTIAVAAAAGKFRAARLRELVDMAAFRRTRHYRMNYAARRIEDRMWVSFPVNADAESHFVFDRVKPHRRFGRTELRLAADMLRDLGWFHRQALLSHGLLVAKTPLTPAQQRVARAAADGGVGESDRGKARPEHSHDALARTGDFPALWGERPRRPDGDLAEPALTAASEAGRGSSARPVRRDGESV
jgi:hypothetical protein